MILWNTFKVYSKGDVVAENLVTGTDGKVVLTDLHLGTYVVTETKSIDGYTINTKAATVKIEYKDQNVTVQAEDTTILNARQKASVEVTKKDSATEKTFRYRCKAPVDVAPVKKDEKRR